MNRKPRKGLDMHRMAKRRGCMGKINADEMPIFKNIINNICCAFGYGD